jgi:cystathionine gamma-synthase
MKKPPTRHPETLAVHAGLSDDESAHAVMPPLHLSTTFRRAPDGSYPKGYSYIRDNNPNRAALEARVAALEGGCAASAFASGSAASLAVFSSIAPRSHIVATRGAYHGTLRQLRELVAPWGHDVSVVDTSDLDAVRGAVRDDTGLLWLETPNNPMLRIADIAACAALCRERGVLLACDNTFATPIFQRPLALGADVVMHSSTKYFGGHSDVAGGIVVVRDDERLAQRLSDWQSLSGAVPAPFDCYLISRSIMSLPCRVRSQAASAQRIADMLAQHAAIDTVFYPGLASHDGHDVARRQMQGFGALLSFTLRGGEAAAWRVCEKVRLFTPATSFGGAESTIEHRASIEGPGTDTPDSLLRVSVGLEHVDDLIADLERALS